MECTKNTREGFNPRRTLRRRGLWYGLLLLAACGESSPPPETVGETSAGTAQTAEPAVAEYAVAADLLELWGPGRPYEVPPYTLTVPHGGWISRSLDGQVLLIRKAEPGLLDELAYIEVYNLPDLPEKTEQALATGVNPQPAMLEELRELIRERAASPEFGVGRSGEIAGCAAVTQVYFDLKKDFNGNEVKAYNEVSLIIAGSQAHLFTAYCYADEQQSLADEFAAVQASLAITPPPPPPVKTPHPTQSPAETPGSSEASSATPAPTTAP